MTTDINHPSVCHSVSFMFDTCHLLKNVRSALGEIKILYAGGDKIEWRFITELHKLQSTSNLHLCNKLKGVHINYTKNKMKVSLAAQTLSSSVATAIDFLREDMKMPEFAGSEATCYFLRCFDKLFNLLNSTIIRSKGFKSTITPWNLVIKQRVAHSGMEYIKSLKDQSGKPLLATKRKTGFVGFLVTLQSIIRVAERLLHKGYGFILTYRFSQDHLETLFSRIRRRRGWNNYPNVLQFKFALRSLLIKKGVLASGKGNCVSIPSPDNALSVYKDLEESQPSPSTLLSLPVPESSLRSLLTKPGPYHQHVLHYIAGYIEKKMLEKTKCEECPAFFSSGSSAGKFSELTQRRDNGGLRFAHQDVITAVTKTDQILRQSLTTSNVGPVRSVNFQTTLRVALSMTEELGRTVFQILHQSESHIESEDSHHVQITKFITNNFCRIVLHHHGKIYTERYIQKDNGTVLRKLNKTVLFLHQ